MRKPTNRLAFCAVVLATIYQSVLAVPESGDDKGWLRVYEVNRTVAEFPEKEDLSTPEPAYAAWNRAWASGDEAAFRRLSGKPPGDAKKREMSDKAVYEILNSRIIEVRVFRDTYAGIIAQVPAAGTLIDLRSFELKDGRWLNRGQSMFRSFDDSAIDKARKKFAAICGHRLPKPIRPKVEDPEAYLKPFVDFLKAQGEEPKAFVMKALARHKVVIIGETHHRPRYWEFNASLVTHPDFTKLVGTIYMELPLNDQELVDKFLSAEELDTMPIIEMLRDMLWMGWPDQPMLDFFVTVWRVNQDLPREERLRIVLVDMERPWKEIKERKDWRKYNVDRNMFMADNIRKDLPPQPEEKRNVLFIVGVGHTMLNLHVPSYPGEGPPEKSAGWHLRQKLGPDDVFAIMQHRPVMTNMGRVDGRLCLGLFDSAFAAMDNKPIAFPLSTGPFGEQPFDAMPDRRFAGTYADGYSAFLYLGPLEDEIFSPLISGFYTDEFVQELERRTRIMWGKPWSEAYRKKPDAESFIAWMKSWGKPRKWRHSLGPMNAWYFGDKWEEVFSEKQDESVLNHSEVIAEAARNLLEAIRSADYDNPGDWREFLGQPYYCVQTNYPAWMRWVCDNFKRNPIESVELGEVHKGDGKTSYKITFKDGTVREGQFHSARPDRPTIPYKLTLKDGTILEGVLPFQYQPREESWMGTHGLDWHLLKPPLELVESAKLSHE